MLGRVRLMLAILLLPTCLQHTGETKSNSSGYYFDVSKLGYVSVRYIDSDGKEWILVHSIARLPLTSQTISVPELTDTAQLQRAGSDAQQELHGIKSPAVAMENFYVISEAEFYLQDHNNKNYFCKLADIPLGSKQNFSLTDDCQENAQEASLIYFKHNFNTTEHKLDEKILQIDCEINYGDKKQVIHLAVQNGTIVDDQGRYAFAKQANTSFKIKCRNSFLHKPVFERLQFVQSTSKEVKANTSQFACFKFSDGIFVFQWGSVKGKNEEACNPDKEPLSFYFSDTDLTRNNDDVPLYLRAGNPFSVIDHKVTDKTLQKDIRVLTQCDDCLPAQASQLHCTTVCKNETFAHADQVAAPGTIIDAGANKHYSQRMLCKDETQPLSALSEHAALTCKVFAHDKPSEPSDTATLPLTREIVKAGKVCVDFTSTKEITISAAANCNSKLRFFFGVAKKSQ